LAVAVQRLDESVLPRLIDGQKRKISKYEEAVKLKAAPNGVTDLLSARRLRISRKIAKMEAIKSADTHASS
jgi:hypothetical protein